MRVVITAAERMANWTWEDQQALFDAQGVMVKRWQALRADAGPVKWARYRAAWLRWRWLGWCAGRRPVDMTRHRYAADGGPPICTHTVGEACRTGLVGALARWRAGLHG